MAEIGLSLGEFDYELPPELIAQRPAGKRDESRLLVLDRKTGRIAHKSFPALLDYIDPGDCLVVNETRVRPARLLGRKATGAAVELLLLKETANDTWEALAKPGRRLSVGAIVEFDGVLQAKVVGDHGGGRKSVKFSAAGPVGPLLAEIGSLALPPYIREPLSEPGRYQTVFANKPGSTAAPTAGLHFTQELLDRIEAAGARLAKVSLDIGIDTFRPIQVADLGDHKMHSEAYDVPTSTADVVNETKAAGGKIIAVGTTTVRALESSARASGRAEAGAGTTDLFIYPGFDFKVVDKILTNFHLPKSTLLVMVSAFAGRENIMRAYAEAVAERYRFYSFGDAMLIHGVRSCNATGLRHAELVEVSHRNRTME